MRFSAALMVMAFHLGFWIWAGPPSSTALRASGAKVEFEELGFLAFGRVGVEIFFVLSGFIIAYSAERASTYEFLRSRAVRLLPAVWIISPLTLIAAFLANFAPPEELAVRFLRTFFFFPLGPYIDGVYWTLGIEVAFYTLVFILLLIGRFSWLPATIAVVGLISSVHWLVADLGPTRAVRWGLPTLYERCLQLILLDHGCFFALGVFLWLSLLKRFTAVRLLLMAWFSIGGFASIWFWSEPLSAMSGGAMSPLAPGMVWIVSVAGVALSVKFNASIWGKGRFTSAARVIGLTTYPMYLLHDLVGAAAFGWLLRLGVNKYWALLSVLFAVSALALLIAIRIEPVVQAGLRDALDRIARYLQSRHKPKRLDAMPRG